VEFEEPISISSGTSLGRILDSKTTLSVTRNEWSTRDHGNIPSCCRALQDVGNVKWLHAIRLLPTGVDVFKDVLFGSTRSGDSTNAGTMAFVTSREKRKRV
jgi:hypothetical protein